MATLGGQRISFESVGRLGLYCRPMVISFAPSLRSSVTSRLSGLLASRNYPLVSNLAAILIETPFSWALYIIPHPFPDSDLLRFQLSIDPMRLSDD